MSEAMIERAEVEAPTRPPLKYLLRNVAAVVLIAILLLVSAGTLTWWAGWIYIGIRLLAQIAMHFLVAPELVEERGRRQHKNQKSWDRFFFTGFGQITARVVPIVAGLNYRFEWAPELNSTVRLVAIAVVVLGWALFVWSMRVNSFFAAVVRIQDDRGQTVTSGGPYGWVRHPGYVGMIMFSIAEPVLLGSLWATIAGVIAVGLLVGRTALEDRTLRQELNGYEEYATRVRWRLVPGVW